MSDDETKPSHIDDDITKPLAGAVASDGAVAIAEVIAALKNAATLLNGVTATTEQGPDVLARTKYWVTKASHRLGQIVSSDRPQPYRELLARLDVLTRMTLEEIDALIQTVAARSAVVLVGRARYLLSRARVMADDLEGAGAGRPLPWDGA